MNITELRIIAPQLASVSDDMLNSYLSIAKSLLDARVWGAQYKNAILFLAAHLATLGSSSGSGRVVNSVTVGRWSEQYASYEDHLDSTIFGKLFLSLRRSRSSGKARLIRPHKREYP